MQHAKFLRTGLVVAAALLLSGCAPTTKWAWNNYSNNLWDYYAQDLSEEDYLAALLGAEEQAHSTGQRLAPGLAAEIGTQYVRMGRVKEGLAYYELEMQTWPESKPFMTALINGLKNRANAPEGDTSKAAPTNRKVPKADPEAEADPESAAPAASGSVAALAR